VSQYNDLIASAIADAKVSSYEPAKHAPAVTALTRWSDGRSVPLEVSAVFSRKNIASFIDTGLPTLSTATRGNYASQLLRTAEALLDELLAPRPLTALAPSDPSVPYTAEEQELQREWAHKQKKSRRTDAQIFVSLGLGAGLSAQEIANFKARDVSFCDQGATIVSVAEGRVRNVPLLRRWERAVLRRARELAPDEFMFLPGRTGAGKNLIWNFVARGGGLIYVQTQRMRSTWVVTHMTARSPLPALVEAAGVDSLEASPCSSTRNLRFLSGDHEA
jgi:hypothetical protein